MQPENCKIGIHTERGIYPKEPACPANCTKECPFLFNLRELEEDGIYLDEIWNCVLRPTGRQLVKSKEILDFKKQRDRHSVYINLYSA